MSDQHDSVMRNYFLNGVFPKFSVFSHIYHCHEKLISFYFFTAVIYVYFFQIKNGSSFSKAYFPCVAYRSSPLNLDSGEGIILNVTLDFALRDCKIQLLTSITCTILILGNQKVLIKGTVKEKIKFSQQIPYSLGI